MVCFLALLIWDLVEIRWELQRGQDVLDHLTLEDVSNVGLTTVVDRAAGHLQRADRRAHQSLPLRLLTTVPVLKDQVAGMRRLTAAVAELGASGATAAHRIDAQLARATEPAGRIALLDVTLNEVDRMQAELQRVDLGGTQGLLPPVRNAHDHLAMSLGNARKKLAEGRSLVTPVRDMIVGPTSYLMLAANNAEMAGGGGLALSAGMLTFDGGDITLGDVTRSGDLRLATGVPLPGDLGTIYRPTGMGTDFRSTTRSPNLPLMGPITAEMMAERWATPVDGILIVDAVALRDIMRVTGGVSVEGNQINAKNVLAQVLHENYLTYDERAERVSFQGEIAKAVFESLDHGNVDATRLAAALLTSGQGRHVALWSAQPALESVWEELGIAGALDPTGLMISFQNYGADKMDWYLRPTSTMQVTRLPSGDFRAHLTMRMRVPARAQTADASQYILGPEPNNHGIFLTVHLPAAAYDIDTDDAGGFTTEGIDPPMQVRTFLETVPAGKVFEREIDFSLPRAMSSLVLLPSARMVPLPLTIDGQTSIDDAVATPFTWSAAHPDEGLRGPQSLWVRAIAVTGLAATVFASSSLALAVLRRRRRMAESWLFGAARGSAASALICSAAAWVIGALS